MRSRSFLLAGVLLLGACGGTPALSPSLGTDATAAPSAAPVTVPPATPTRPAVVTPEPTPTPSPMRIAAVECTDAAKVRIHVVIDHPAGIVTYRLWSTWGGGGETTRSFPTPYRTSVDEEIEFVHAIHDPEPSRVHQFGLEVTIAGATETYLTYEIEPGTRCPGH